MSLQTVLSAAFVRVGQEDKALRTLINGNASDLSALTTTAKNNLVAALNEVRAAAVASEILDTAPNTSTTKTYSASKITSLIDAAIASLVAASPATLDTLNELAAALGDDPNFATTMTNALASKAPLASPAFSGNPTVPTQTAGNNSTRIASTAFVTAAVAAHAADIGDPNHSFLTDYTTALA
ncbi:hypothetical protein CSC94_12800 [Zhengella mangrovi]|uniref:Phage tail protein n=1 Tax=Zhengella mangrovi TaxID=1982044 RepID=A0A2G1QM39_9HYPH|nr:hypothetical protein [Zhengella mangrovi]PHP66562.1 hypothetical protein CSC94_12800 [Zhengella mangrovi]